MKGQKYPRLLARYEETVVEPRRNVFRQVLRRGVANGELRGDIDVDAALFMMVGAVMVRGKYEPEVISPGVRDARGGRAAARADAPLTGLAG